MNPSPDSCLKALARMFVADATAITRPNDTNAYAANDAVANSTTAGSVTPISLTVSDLNDAPVSIHNGRIICSDTAAVAAQFKLHLFRSSPTAVAGDNAAFALPAVAKEYLGSMSGTFVAGPDGATAALKPDSGQDIVTRPTSGAKTIFGLLQTLSVYTPAAQSTFTVMVAGFQGRA